MNMNDDEFHEVIDAAMRQVAADRNLSHFEIGFVAGGAGPEVRVLIVLAAGPALKALKGTLEAMPGNQAVPMEQFLARERERAALRQDLLAAQKQAADARRREQEITDRLAAIDGDEPTSRPADQSDSSAGLDPRLNDI